MLVVFWALPKRVLALSSSHPSSHPSGPPPGSGTLIKRHGWATSMSGVTACLLGDTSVARELGKVGTQSDIHLHDFKQDGRDVTVIVPARYPEQLKCLSYAVTDADAAVLVIAELNAQAGEQILAADAAGIPHGIILLTNYLQPEQIAPLLAGTGLAHWPVLTESDWPRIRAHLGQAPERSLDGPLMVPVDHHFDVKGVGAVILGVIKQGTLQKGETLHAYPDKVICPVRSIQCHDVDVPQAVAGDRVGLALRNTKADQLDRGMVLAHPDADLNVHKTGDTVTFTLRRNRFSKQPLASGSVTHLGVGMQFVPVRLSTDAPAAGTEAIVTGVLAKGLVVAPGETGVLWHVDGAPQRVVGAVSFP